MPDAPLGTELAFFDDAERVTAVADEGNNGMIHWFDKRDDHNADAYEVPIGAGVKYKLPEGERGSNRFGVRLKSASCITRYGWPPLLTPRARPGWGERRGRGLRLGRKFFREGRGGRSASTTSKREKTQ